MKTRKLITDIEKWLAVIDNDNFNCRELENTELGNAYNLLLRAVKILRKNNAIDEQMKRHSTGLKRAIDDKE